MVTKTDEDQKRTDDRLDVIWDGVATIDDIDFPCEVENISTAGVLMRLDVDLAHKQQFLLDVEGLREYAVEVAWANRPLYGLTLLVGDDLKLKNHADKVGLKSKA